ncbi:hypothetical protein HELRODRAFT_81976 [Helobdella robusta]|uniref:3-oxo-5alpha-steroid 4-dehydrogenase (NADP(+)) n=1 Tax=Helobdella robusta TaxID=6412 RepID=T1G4L2_HELRO|nr:hypothetical protein HELRODRAFT_81976 [Helobdella robusta]ESO01331.1 hypothetical protein HELRODRAFT_81976 [Helobdella robusta]
MYPFDTVTTLSIVMILAAVLTFVGQQFQTACYGRYALHSKFSLKLNPKLSWFVQESPAFFLPVYFILDHLFLNQFGIKSNQVKFTNLFLLSVFALHYFNRSMVYPFKTGSVNKIPIYITLLAFTFCCYNGYLQSKYLMNCHYDSDYMYSFNFIIGMSLFFIGMYLNIKSDSLMSDARKLRGPGTYVIPKGGLYEYVSCANYFSEIIEWVGFAIACWSFPAFAFALYSISYMVPRAKQNHLWYLEHFKPYPKDRRILFPYIW